MLLRELMAVHLEVNNKLCEKCKEAICMKSCPHKLELNALKCMHCNPEKAPCALACKQGAFYKVTEQILAIDENKCNGCGACLEAYPYDAIVIKNGKAANVISAQTTTLKWHAFRNARTEQ